MRKRKTFLGMIVFLAILLLGVGYASISDITLDLNGSTASIKANADFIVEYDTAHTVGKSTTDTIAWAASDNRAVVTGVYNSTSSATMTVNLDADHTSAYAIFKVDNKSSELGATLTPSVTQITGTNTQYFNDITTAYYTDANCTTALSGTLAHGQSAYLKVTVSLKKNPIDDISSASFNV